MKVPELTEAVRVVVAEFVNRESNRQSLITVTRVQMDVRALEAHVFVSVFPDTHARTALEFLERRADDVRAYLKKRIRSRTIPRITFVQDPNIAGLERE